jgi:hypothetical protein
VVVTVAIMLGSFGDHFGVTLVDMWGYFGDGWGAPNVFGPGGGASNEIGGCFGGTVLGI